MSWLRGNRVLGTVGALAVAWTLGFALFPVYVGNEVGMHRTSCGTAVSSLFGNGLSRYGPALGPICQDHAQERLVIWLAFLVPFIAAVALGRPRSARASRAVPLDVPGRPRWPDALTYASMFVVPLVLPAVMFFVAKDRAFQRNAARALELQLVVPVSFGWLLVVSRPVGDAGTPWVLVLAAFVAAAAASTGCLICAVLALVAPRTLDRWQPLFARRGGLEGMTGIEPA